MKKTLNILLIVALSIFALMVLFTLYRFWGVKTGRLIRMDNGVYLTPTEFHKIYPPQNVVLPDKNKPEEVYTKFREAIIVGNIDEALKYIAERRRDEYKENLIKNLELYKNLPDFGVMNLRESTINDIERNYKYTIDEKEYYVELEKTWDGYWFIYGI